MRPTDLFRALVYPFTVAAVLLPLLVFWALIAFALWGGLLGMFLLFLVVPAALRSQMIVLEARARGAEPATPDIEFFSWFGNGWTLFPVPVTVALVWFGVIINDHLGGGWLLAYALLCASLFPAFLGVLAITHSPLQSLSPVALARFLGKSGGTIWIASAFLLLGGFALSALDGLPTAFRLLSLLAFGYAFASLVGSLIEPYGIVDDVDIPAPEEKSPGALAGELEQARTAVLNHAYGFISRGNRDGGFRHIADHIDREADVAAAWAWFFARMLKWENREHALFFAQRYIHDLLVHGERVAAVKVMLRCRLENERFRPLAGDLAAAIQAAEATGNAELAAVLKRG